MNYLLYMALKLFNLHALKISYLLHILYKLVNLHIL
jgi:hypothetical protein